MYGEKKPQNPFLETRMVHNSLMHNAPFFAAGLYWMQVELERGSSQGSVIPPDYSSEMMRCVREEQTEQFY